jgi:hypothetical protein
MSDFQQVRDALQVDGSVRRDCLQWIRDQYADEFIADMLDASLGEGDLTPQEVRDTYFDHYARHILGTLDWPVVQQMFNLGEPQ